MARPALRPGQRPWQGIYHNEAVYNGVHNGLVGIILDGVEGVSPNPANWHQMKPEVADAILAKAHKALADFESQAPAPGGSRGQAFRWMERHTNELRRLLSDAEAVRSGSRASKMTPEDYERRGIDLRGPPPGPTVDRFGRPLRSVRDYEAVDNSGRRIAGPFKHYSDAKGPADQARGYVKYVPARAQAAEAPIPASRQRKLPPHSTSALKVATDLSKRVGGTTPKDVPGGFRWSEQNEAAQFTTYSPEHSQKVVCVLAVFNQDGSLAIDFFSDEGLSEIATYENIGHQIYAGPDLAEMQKDIEWVWKTVDEYAASWDEGGGDLDESRGAPALAESEHVPFHSWKDVIAYAETGGPLFYKAPMDRNPTRLAPRKGRGEEGVYEAHARTIRIWPYGSTGRGKNRTADPFTADSGHLSRFSRPS